LKISRISRKKSNEIGVVLLHREDKTLEEQDNDYRRLLNEIAAKGGIPLSRLSMLTIRDARLTID
jgi:hypothetical protein